MRNVCVAAVACQLDERLRHERRAQPMLLRDRLHHVLEERMPVGRDKRVVEVPVHLELAIRVLVIVLIRAPAKRQHAVADLGDHVVAAHQCLLVVAGLRLMIGVIRDRLAVRRDQEEFALDASLHLIAAVGRALHLAFQNDAWRLVDLLAVHPEIGGEPAHLRLPRQLDQAARVRHGEQIGIGRRHVEPGGKASKSSAFLRHLADRRRGNELCSHRAEQVEEADQEVLDASGFRFLALDPCHSPTLVAQQRPSQPAATNLKIKSHLFRPVSNAVPANGTRAIAAASMVSATRSSGSSLWTWLLPHARAIVCVSSVSTAR